MLTSDQSKLCLYKDDSDLLVTGKAVHKVEVTTKNDLLLVNKFFRSKNLFLNLKKQNKNNLLSFHAKPNKNHLDPLIDLHNSSITQLHETNFFGLLLDENLNWKSHILN